MSLVTHLARRCVPAAAALTSCTPLTWSVGTWGWVGRVHDGYMVVGYQVGVPGENPGLCIQTSTPRPGRDLAQPSLDLASPSPGLA